MNHVYFYQCQRFIGELSKKGYQKTVQNKLKELSQRKELQSGRDSITLFKGLFVLRTSGTARTLIQQETTEKEGQTYSVYFVRAVIDHDDWVKTISQQVKNGNWLLSYPLSEEEKQAGFEGFFAQKAAQDDTKLSPPPYHMTAWFQDFKLKLGLEIYEAESWVQYATNPTQDEGMREKDLTLFHDLLFDVFSENTANLKLLKQGNYNQLWIAENNKVGIIFAFIEENAKKHYLIYNGANLITQQAYWQETQKTLKTNIIEIPATLEEIQRLALRAYPSYPLKPQQSELWDRIQKSSENSNYSLLKEQIDFLEDFKFPSYINGQAGSGKSTMLYYIFANAYLLKKLNAIKGEIIFLTENETLLENTKTAIKDLLVNNPEFGLNFQTDFEDFDNCFASFKRFLLELLPEDDRVHFPMDKHLDFSLFKKRYEDSNINQSIKRKYSAEESWFAITTYIKGYESDCNITANNYEDRVSQKSRKLSKEKITGIEQNVLPFYEKLIEEENHWDRLRIIDYIQENLSLSKKFEIVICDEAQDFCRVELRFILRLCMLLRYDLSKTEQVPVVFAGDSNQTVNPTGFRLDEMKDILYEELKKMANFDKLKLQGEVIYNPNHNYRSSQAVVNFANYIQYYRKKILGINVEKPQEAKQQEIGQDQGNQNVFLAQGDVLNNETLIERLKYKAFILPIDEQEKEGYTKEQALFTEKIEEADIKTAIESKGAEYKQVVVYGFGHSYLEKFNTLDFDKSNEEHDFEKRYFFNKLYVGITRAKEELIIIDSKQAKTEFWQKLLSLEITDENWQTISEHQDLLLYDTNTILESSPETALDNAHNDKEQGMIHQNPSQLKVAAKQFFRIGQSNEQNECFALAEKIQGNWKEAAQYFAKTKNGLEQSADCYWQGNLLQEMLINTTSLQSHEQVIRVALAKLMVQEETLLSENDLNELYQNKHLVRKLTEQLSWRTALIAKLIEVAQSIEIKDKKRHFAEVLLEIVQDKDTALYEAIARLFYSINELERAILAWDNIEAYEEKQIYIEAKIKVARLRGNSNDEVIWLDKLLPFQDEAAQRQSRNTIIQCYQNHQDIEHEPQALLAVYHAMLYLQTDENTLLLMAQQAEQSHQRSNITLEDFYVKTLKAGKAIQEVYWNFLLERWVKYSLKRQSLEQINEQYKQFTQDSHKNFVAFSEEEISNIPTLPEVIIKKPKKHFENIIIHNFRRFEHLELKNLGQFNLIVGDNNTGKTSLLEALTFSPDEAEFAQRLALCYAERANDFGLDTLKEDFWEEFVFHSSEKQNLRFEIKEGRNTAQYQFPDKETIQLKALRNLTQKDAVKNPLIPFGKGFDKYLAQSYFDNIHKQGKASRKAFVENLSVFIPEIDTIIADSEEILVESTNNDKGVPLYQYGEGANKLFRILLQMTLHKGERIMIDEIDAGIHFSRFKKFWKIILQIAHKEKIQLFATTHNLECIQYFSEALEELSTEENNVQQSARSITLYQTQEGNVKARTRQFEAFNEAVEEGYNIRGGE